MRLIYRGKHIYTHSTRYTNTDAKARCANGCDFCYEQFIECIKITTVKYELIQSEKKKKNMKAKQNRTKMTCGEKEKQNGKKINKYTSSG